MTEQKAAIIDMGTNTFHLLLARWEEGAPSIFYREKSAVKIGKGGINKGLITPDAFKRAVDAIVHFKKIIEKNNISAIYAVATSGVRNAINGKKLAEEILLKTGIQVHIISGDTEAELIYRGVKSALDLGMRNSLVMDIGGGSVEFILCNHTNIFWKGSFEIGAQRLVDQFHTEEPIKPSDSKLMVSYLDEKLNELFEKAQPYKPLVLIGSAGSFDTLCEIDMIEKGYQQNIENEKEYSLSISSFEKISKDIIGKSRVDRMLIPGMIDMRVDMIVVACILTDLIIKKLQVTEIRVSTYALKEGVLDKIMNKEIL